MQMIYSSVLSPTARLQRFTGGRKYMQRSQKRASVPRPTPAPQRAPEPEKKPPRRKRRRAGFFYKLLTFLLLLTLWPAGLALLWRRKIRWRSGAKLLASVVSLAACILLLGFALTVDTGNAGYAAVQDSVNSYLDAAAEAIIAFGNQMGERMAVAYEDAGDFGSALWRKARTALADGIDAGVDFAAGVREKLDAKLAASPASDKEAETEANGATPEPTATPAPPVRAGSLPVYVPGSRPEPADGETVTSGMLLSDGTLKPDVAFKTASPETLARTFTVKSAGEATVYYNNGSKFYHRTPQCGPMLTSTAHRFEETRDRKYRRCNTCGAPDKALLDEAAVAWIDGDGVAHLNDECSAFSGDWSLTTAKAAVEAGNPGCEVCGASRYLKAVADGCELILRTPEPTTAPESDAEIALNPITAPEADAKATPETTPESTAAAQ